MKRDRPSLLADVARMAGVSLATASRALSDPELVHIDTRKRVQEAVAKLGYVPHGAARALATKRSKTIGVVIPTLDNPIFASSIQAMQKRLANDGYTLLLGSHEYDLATEARVVSALVERGVDGLVLVGADHEPALYALLDKTGLPYELTWTLDGGAFHHCLGFSNRAAAAQVVLHLLNLGHRRFAMISGHTASNDRARERAVGVRETLEARGLALAPQLLIQTDFTIHDGREALGKVVAADPKVTAVVCGNDILAIGALIEASARAIPVPGTMSITGFDDIELAREWNPSVTTVRLPYSEIGARAAERMLLRLDGKSTARVEEISVALVQRNSSGPAPRAGRDVKRRQGRPEQTPTQG